MVEGARGKRLGEVFEERIFGSLGMDSSGFVLTDDMRSRRTTMHQRQDDGSLTPMPGFELPQDPEQHMGGHGLYMPIGDYMKFIRMVINEGAGAYGRVLEAETVQAMGQNGLGDTTIKMLPGAIPTLSNDAEFFPGMPKGWSYTFMVNHEEAPTGRPAGTPRRGARMGGPRQPLLLDRPPERRWRVLGDPDPALRRPRLVRRLHGLRDRGL